MSFLKDLFSGDPAKSAAKHEKRARNRQAEGNEAKAADEWAAAGHAYTKIPDYQKAYEAFVQAAQFYLALKDDKRETDILFEAVDAAVANQDYASASSALTQVTRLGTRKKDDELLIRAYALQTILLLVANDLAKAKQTHREAEKVEKRFGRKKVKTPVYSIASLLVSRFIEGKDAPEDIQLPSRFHESDTVNQLITDILSLYQSTQTSRLNLTLDKEEVKIKEPVSGQVTISFPESTTILDTQISLPSNIALLEPISAPEDAMKRFKIPLLLEARLPGIFDVGPLVILFQKDTQHFQLKSNSVELQITAAKPRIELIAEPLAPPHSQEEFELIVRVENNSHGDAADVTITVTLPPELLLKTGTLEKRIITLPAQQHVQFPLFLIATKAGSHEGEISCHYQGPSGRRRSTEGKFSVEILPRVRKEKD
jgi:tetratricopeptide (TPR) repeat protein